MMIYKNDGKKGFAVSANIIRQENLKAGGLTLAILGAILLIVKAAPLKKADGKKPKKEKSKKTAKKGKSSKKGLWKVLIIPAAAKAAKAIVTENNLLDLVKKVKAGENVTTDIFGKSTAEEETQKEKEPVTVCGMEIIEPIDIDSEERVYEYI